MESETMLTPRGKNPLYRALRGGSNKRRYLIQNIMGWTVPENVLRGSRIQCYAFLVSVGSLESI